MFNSLNAKLYFIFILFSVLCLSIIFLSNFYSHKKENIDIAQHSIDEIYTSNLFEFHYDEHFLSTDIRNIKFFKTGTSELLQTIDSIEHAIKKQISQIERNDETKDFNIDYSLQRIIYNINLHDSAFNQIVRLIKLRGYADYGYIGTMRDYSHKLEKSGKVDMTLYLLLRRNEKDYMLRYESKFIDTFKLNASILNKQIAANSKLTQNEKDTLLSYSTKYVAYFDSMTLLDKKIGIKDNSALNLKIDEIESAIINDFNNLTNSAYKKERNLYANLNFSFLVYSILLVIISLLFSYYLANRITKPILQLAEKTHLFVESGFENLDDFEIKTSDDEIKNLVRNFSILKKEVVELLHDFKNKVEERTKKIELQNDELLELNATKDKFFSIIAHDLKSPFNTILGFSEILVNDVENFRKEEIKEYASNIHSSANQTLALLENLLDWARLQRGLIIPNLKRQDLKTIAADVCLFSNEIAKHKNISIINTITSDCFANCDIDMTKTVLRNLISNAIKFTNKNGSVSINAQIKGSFIEIQIKDTGIGIQADIIPHLFKIDKNISTHGTADESGTGLGLLLCKELIEKQGGTIWVTSEIGKGSSFYFTLKQA